MAITETPYEHIALNEANEPVIRDAADEPMDFGHAECL